MRMLAVLGAALPLCLSFVAPRPAFPAPEAPPPLVGTWSCPKAFILEAGEGPTTITFRADGSYLLTDVPDGAKGKHTFRQSGAWSAEDGQVVLQPATLQVDSDAPRELGKRRGNGIRHGFSVSGDALTLDGLAFRRAQPEAASPAGGKPAGGLSPFDQYLLRRRAELKRTGSW